MDARHLRQTFTVLAVSIVYRGCSLPMAWAIVPGQEPGTWRPH
ncbi:MAG TPA: hypothetical protein VHO69_18065 [Phototrophicaceae bacterium]|nr:hypothetical protein [Phototrophicaceae bacterium]